MQYNYMSTDYCLFYVIVYNKNEALNDIEMRVGHG